MGGNTGTSRVGAPGSRRPIGSNAPSSTSGSTRGNYGRTSGTPSSTGSSRSSGTSGSFGKGPVSTPARSDRPGERGRSVDARSGNPSHPNEVHTNAGEAHVPRVGSGNARTERTRYTPPRHISEEHGHRVTRDDRNRIREIHTRDSRGRDLAIHRDYHGGIHYETRRPDGRRVVGYGHGSGFYERRYVTHGTRVYYQRTYIYGGRPYAVAYRYYPYRGVYYYRYAPVAYYRPVFYGWAYRPWGVPVVYHWGWYSHPWYGYYGYYFNPYPSYLSASLWLTDFLLAESLRSSYEARANAAVAEANANAAAAQANAAAAQANADAAAQYAAQSQDREVALTPEVKQMIANEVERQLQAQQAAADQPQASAATPASAPGAAAVLAEEVPDALDPNQRIFIVANNLDLAGEQGECTVTGGDVLMRLGTTPDENNRIGVTVVSSKKGDCPVNTNSDVEVTELQEMHNHFREKLDNGLKTLAENQGKNGLPQAPDVSTVAGEAPAPTPDSEAGAELEHQEKDADKTEKQVKNVAPGGK